MSLFKSIVITLVIFLIIGLAGWLIYLFQQENKADETLAKAKDFYKQSKYIEAIDLVNENISLSHKEDFLFIKFKSLMELGRFNETEVVSNDLIKMNPRNDEYYYLIGLLHYNNANYSKSAEALEKAIKLQPQNTDYKLYLARVSANDGKNEQALKVYEQIMKEDPKYEVAWAETASIYNSLGNKKKTLEIRLSAAKKFANNAYDQYMLGVICDELDLKPQAISALKRALELQPDQDTDAKSRFEKLTGKPYSITVGKQEKIPLTGNNNLMIVNARMNGVSGRFLVDTGATSSVIYDKFIKKNKIKISTNTRGVVEMANGNRNFAPTVYVDVQLGQNTIYDLRIFILPSMKLLNVDGIIGMDVLNNFNFQIDKDNKYLVIVK